MFAVIKTGAKQYMVAHGQKLKIENLDAKDGAKLTFGEVLLVSDDKKTEVGEPFIKGAKVEAKVLKQGRARKVIVITVLISMKV